MHNLKINYNPVTYKFNVESSFDYERTSFGDFITVQKERNERIFNWTEELFTKFASSINEESFNVEIICDEFEKNEIIRQIEQFSKKEGAEKLEIFPSFHIVDTDESYNLIQDFEDFFSKSKNVIVKETFGRVKSKLEKRHKQKVNIVAAATMSAGKSTVLNSLIGKTLLPSKNEATTATICKIRINNNLNSFIGKISEGENQVFEKDVDENWVSLNNEKANAPDSMLNIFLEGPVSDFETHNMDVFFVDTPGPNNSQNPAHKEATYTYLKDEENKPILMYILNATQLRTKDELHTLKEVSNFLNENKNSNDRIIFILNRIDDLDPDKEPLAYKINKTKEYLNSNFDIKNPKIFPLSAEYARLAIKEESGEKLSRHEKSNLDSFVSKFKPDEDYVGIPTFNHLPLFEEFKNQVRERLGESQFLDNMIYSGLFGLKAYLQYYIKYQQRNELIHDVYKILYGLSENINSQIVIEIDQKNIESKKRQYEDLKKKEKSITENKFNSLKNEILKIKPDLSFSDEIMSTKFNKKIQDIQERLKEKFEINSCNPNSIFKNFQDNINNIIIGIKTSFESKANICLSNYLKELKEIAHKHFNLNDRNQFEELLNFDLNLQIASIDLNSLNDINIISEKILIKDNFKWYNPATWMGAANEYETRNYIESNIIWNNIVNPNVKIARDAFTQAEMDINNKADLISKNFIISLKDTVDQSLKKIEDDYKKSLNISKKEFEIKKKDLTAVKNEMVLKFKKISTYEKL